jgi:hypothetical protein
MIKDKEELLADMMLKDGHSFYDSCYPDQVKRIIAYMRGI